jgi:peptidoglycan hydrolase-like protein with peptidoglycan-binding domain
MRVATGVTLAGVVGAAGFAVADRRAEHTGTAQVTEVNTGTATVDRADVADRRQVDGTLGYAGSYHVVASGPGLLTGLPAVGTVVTRGRSVYEVDGRPVRLMYGRRPAWRAFGPGMTDGADVQQLEANLKALGYGAGLTVDRHFTTATYHAVRRWQRAVTLTVTGSVPLGQVVFLPDAVRIAGADLKLGEQVQPGAVVEHGTSARPAITIQLSPQQLPSANVGDRVVVTLPDGSSRGGKITQIGAVAESSGGAADGDQPGPGPGGDDGGQSTVPVTVQADGTISGFLDRAQVQVAITIEYHKDVLAVPITALNALPGGGYEVIVVDGPTTRRVPVQTGLFDEFAGLAEVSGPGLAEGQHVQVPSDDA